jgi:hypothetical protein
MAAVTVVNTERVVTHFIPRERPLDFFTTDFILTIFTRSVNGI